MAALSRRAPATQPAQPHPHIQWNKDMLELRFERGTVAIPSNLREDQVAYIDSCRKYKKLKEGTNKQQ